jgi:hypothetical protein
MKMDNELKKKLLKLRGTISQGEADAISKIIPNTSLNNYRKSITGVAAGEKELEYLLKMLSQKGIR